MFSYCFPNKFPNYSSKDLSHLQSPVQAARYVHSLKNYDKNIGKFKYNEDYYVINDDGYYVINDEGSCNQST